MSSFRLRGRRSTLTPSVRHERTRPKSVRSFGDAGRDCATANAFQMELALLLVGVALVLAFVYVLRKLVWVVGPPTPDVGLGGYAVALILLGLGAFLCFYFAFGGR